MQQGILLVVSVTSIEMNIVSKLLRNRLLKNPISFFQLSNISIHRQVNIGNVQIVENTWIFCRAIMSVRLDNNYKARTFLSLYVFIVYIFFC